MRPEIIGGILGTFSALSFATNAILIRKSMESGNPINAVLGISWISALILLPINIFLYYPNFYLTLYSLLAFIAAGILGVFLGRTFFYEGTKKVGAPRTSAIANGYLIISLIIGVTLLRESIRIGHLIGAFLLTIGVVIVSYESKVENSNLDLQFTSGLIFPFGTMLAWGLWAPIVKTGLQEGTPPTSRSSNTVPDRTYSPKPLLSIQRTVSHIAI